MTVAALFVETGGSYFDLEDVEPWDEARDAKLYAGPHPVVAHPPCQRWGRMWFGQPLHVKLTGERKVLGDDGGCFEAALAAVRRFGGVLEHPERSKAWQHFELNEPPRDGGWIVADWEGGWTCCVEQVAHQLIAVHQRYVPSSSARLAYRAGAGPAVTYWNALARVALRSHAQPK